MRRRLARLLHLVATGVAADDRQARVADAGCLERCCEVLPRYGAGGGEHHGEPQAGAGVAEHFDAEVGEQRRDRVAPAFDFRRPDDGVECGVFVQRQSDGEDRQAGG